MSKAGFIAIAGRPNSGKSTLLNEILHTKISIVTPKPQTTRDRVLGILTEPQGQIVFEDTPGIHRIKKSNSINEYMVLEAQDALRSPNLIWYLVDPMSALKHESIVLEFLEKTQAPVFLLINKMDQVGKEVTEAKVESLEKDLVEAIGQSRIHLEGVRRISGLASTGILELVSESWNYLPEGLPFYPDPDQLSDRPTRFFVKEKIREQLYLKLGDEIPYSCAVEIDKFDENSAPPRIEATIYVERDSQKGMVIGQGGKKIKEIGQAARIEIEEFLGQKIFLGLMVKVLKDWSDQSNQLKKMGYIITGRGKSGKGK